MHNNIMAAGSKDRPPMLGPGRYSQWRSRHHARKQEAKRVKDYSVSQGKDDEMCKQAERRNWKQLQFKAKIQENLPQNRKQAEIHLNVLKPGMYRIATTTTQIREPQLPHASRPAPQGQKASDYDNSDPVPPRQNVVPPAEKTDSSQQGLEFLFSPLLEEYYNPTHETGESSSLNIDYTDVHSFQPQSHDYRWTKDHPLEQVRGNPTMPVQTRQQLATDPEMYMFAAHDELHQFDRLKVWELVDKLFGKMIIKLKWLWKNKKDED
ncbi:hypothetical protein Tco_1457925 [Tanacetum coccineum]